MNNATKQISGYVVVSQRKATLGRPCTTPKAVYVNVLEVNGVTMNAADSTWLPRSLCSDLVIKKGTHEDGCEYFTFTATVAAWWVSKLDFRKAWQIAGYTSPPGPSGI